MTVANLESILYLFIKILRAIQGFISGRVVVIIMPTAYKITSDPFFVSGRVVTSAPDTYTQLEISLPLDSLNQEGILVHAIYFSGDEPDSVAGLQSRVSMQVTSTSKTAMVGARDSNLLGQQQKFIVGGAAEFSGPHVIDVVASNKPYQESDNLGLVATDNIFAAIDSNNQTQNKSMNFRMVCSRIRLTASAYAALVTNELNQN